MNVKFEKYVICFCTEMSKTHSKFCFRKKTKKFNLCFTGFENGNNNDVDDGDNEEDNKDKNENKKV